MKVIGIIAEYNPFHNGHLYQINKIKEKYPDSTIIGVVSSSFTQRGDISILNKWDKTQIALDNGLDLVIELPFVYATQSSDIFAKGALEILNKLKIDTLVFGTESDNLDKIKLLADIQLNNKQYNQKVQDYLSKGFNYPTALNKALLDLSNIKIDTPNDLLALSYIKEIKKNNYTIEVVNIQRTTSYHGEEIQDNITSASNIRRLYLENNDISNLIPYNKDILYKISMNNYFNYLKYKIITESISISKYQTIDEGIENKVIKEINNSNTYEQLIKNIKTKRYTYNKISRMLLHILTNFTKEEAQKIVDGDIDWMIDSNQPLIRELYCKMYYQGMRPMTIVDYTREPFIYGPGNVRITLDYNIRTGLNSVDFLNPDCVTVPAGDAPIILEVKWDAYLPEIKKDAVQIPETRAQAFSKYGQCRIYG